MTLSLNKTLTHTQKLRLYISLALHGITRRRQTGSYITNREEELAGRTPAGRQGKGDNDTFNQSDRGYCSVGLYEEWHRLGGVAQQTADTRLSSTMVDTGGAKEQWHLWGIVVCFACLWMKFASSADTDQGK